MSPQRPRPLVLTNREDYQTDFAHGVVQYTAPCATCFCLAEYVAMPAAPLRVWCPTCEAKA